MTAKLTITHNGKTVNTFEYDGEKALLELSKVLLWKIDKVNKCNVWVTYTSNGEKALNAKALVNSETTYNYHFSGSELSNILQ